MLCRKIWSSLALLLLLAVSATSAAAKEATLEINWPASPKPVLKFSFEKFSRMPVQSEQEIYSTAVTATNLWDKVVNASFSVFLLDRNKMRVGEGSITLIHLRPGESVRSSLTIPATGTMASVQLVPKELPVELQAYGPVKTVAVTIQSVPPGAALKVDGREAGITPAEVKLTPGKHAMEFSREGYQKAIYDLLVLADQPNGGSVSFDLSPLSSDLLELRDGTVLAGDLVSMDATTIVFRARGAVGSYDRRMVKKILLAAREHPASK